MSGGGLRFLECLIAIAAPEVAAVITASNGRIVDCGIVLAVSC